MDINGYQLSQGALLGQQVKEQPTGVVVSQGIFFPKRQLSPAFSFTTDSKLTEEMDKIKENAMVAFYRGEDLRHEGKEVPVELEDQMPSDSMYAGLQGLITPNTHRLVAEESNLVGLYVALRNRDSEKFYVTDGGLEGATLVLPNPTPVNWGECLVPWTSILYTKRFDSA